MYQMTGKEKCLYVTCIYTEGTVVAGCECRVCLLQVVLRRDIRDVVTDAV